MADETMTNERLAALLGKFEEATTDGDLSDVTQEDIGYIYLWLLAEQKRRA